jgi:hypothetical protein
MSRTDGRTDGVGGVFQSLRAMRNLLEEQRRVIERDLGHRQIGVAFCEVLDWLIHRARAVEDQAPANAPITRSYIENQIGDEVETLRLVAKTLKRMAQLMQESEAVVYERRQPIIRLIGRIESEDFAVDTDTFTIVTDPKDWSLLDGLDAPELRVQLEAEKIARAEQAAVYQQRLERMGAAIKGIEAGYAQQIRDLAAPA